MGDLRRGKGWVCWALINSSLLAMRGSNLRSKASDPHLGLSYLPRLAQTWGRKEPKRACDRCGINSLSPEQTEAPGPLPTGISSPQSRGMFILWLEFIGCLDLQDPEFWLSPHSCQPLLWQGGSASILSGRLRPPVEAGRGYSMKNVLFRPPECRPGWRKKLGLWRMGEEGGLMSSGC